MVFSSSAFKASTRFLANDSLSFSFQRDLANMKYIYSIPVGFFAEVFGWCHQHHHDDAADGSYCCAHACVRVLYVFYIFFVQIQVLWIMRACIHLKYKSTLTGLRFWFGGANSAPKNRHYLFMQRKKYQRLWTWDIFIYIYLLI